MQEIEKVLADRFVIAEPAKKEVSNSGLEYNKLQQQYMICEVLHVGPGTKDVSMSLKAGDKVLVPTVGGVKVKIGGKHYRVFREMEAMLTVKE